MTATVSLEKITPGWVRTPEHGGSYDMHSWEERLMPLWWDDASYIRYQADDGDAGEWVTELGFLPHHGPLVRRWVDFEYDDSRVADSRPVRRGWARFESILRDLRLSGAQDRVIIAAADSWPF